jgi:hypothetical protein
MKIYFIKKIGFHEWLAFSHGLFPKKIAWCGQQLVRTPQVLLYRALSCPHFPRQIDWKSAWGGEGGGGRETGLV